MTNSFFKNITLYTTLLTYQLFILLIIPIFLFYKILKIKTIHDLYRVFSICFCYDILGFLFKKASFSNKPSILIHAVSLGEAKVGLYIAERIASNAMRVIILTTTEAGYKFLRNNKSDNIYSFYKPIDLFLYNYILLRSFHIKKCIVVEHDVWPCLVVMSYLLSVPIILINGYFSELSLKRYKLTYNIFSLVLNMFNKIYLQDQNNKRKLSEIKVSKEKLKVIGSLKFLSLVDFQGAYKNYNKVICFGSCHEEEFPFIVLAVKKLLMRHDDINIIIVPRYPEAAFKFFNLLKQYHKRVILVTNWNTEHIKEQNHIVIISQIGTLLSIYEIAAISIVCGSFDNKLEGHNLLEPLSRGSITLYGKYIKSQIDMHNFLSKHIMNGLCKSQTDLTKKVSFFLNNPEKRIRTRQKFNNQILIKKEKINKHIYDLERWCYGNY